MPLEDLIGSGFFPELDEEFEGFDRQFAARGALLGGAGGQGQGSSLIGSQSFNPTGGQFGGEFDPGQTVDPGEQLVDRIVQSVSGRPAGRALRTSIDGITFDFIGGRARARAGVKTEFGPGGPGTGGTIKQGFDEEGFSPVTPEIQARAQAFFQREQSKQDRLRAALTVAGLTGGRENVARAFQQFQSEESRREAIEQQREDRQREQELRERQRKEDLERRERERTQEREDRLKDSEAEFNRKKELLGTQSGTRSAGAAATDVQKVKIRLKQEAATLLGQRFKAIDNIAADKGIDPSSPEIRSKKALIQKEIERTLAAGMKLADAGEHVGEFFLLTHDPDAGVTPTPAKTPQQATTLAAAPGAKTLGSIDEPETAARAGLEGNSIKDLRTFALNSGQDLNKLSDKVVELAGGDVDTLIRLREAFANNQTGVGPLRRGAENFGSSVGGFVERLTGSEGLGAHAGGIARATNLPFELLSGLEGLSKASGLPFGAIKKLRGLSKKIVDQAADRGEGEARLIPALIDIAINKANGSRGQAAPGIAPSGAQFDTGAAAPAGPVIPPSIAAPQQDIQGIEAQKAAIEALGAQRPARAQRFVGDLRSERSLVPPTKTASVFAQAGKVDPSNQDLKFRSQEALRGEVMDLAASLRISAKLALDAPLSDEEQRTKRVLAERLRTSAGGQRTPSDLEVRLLTLKRLAQAGG